MSKNVVLTLEPRFMDEYGEYANLPVFNAHGDIVGYTGGEVPESGNPCEFNRLGDEGFTYCASATEVVRLKAENIALREERDMYRDLVGCMVHPDIPDQLQAENAELRELVRDMYKAFMHGNCYRWCEFKEPCNYISDGRCQWYERMRDLGIEVDA